jgi:NADH-quinone oxidoreductase subunit H
MDVLKLFGKDAITHGFIFDFGAIMAFGGMIATLFFVPIGAIQLYSMSGTLILVIYLMAIAYLGMAMATVGSGNPLASVGISRALTQMLGYEMPFQSPFVRCYEGCVVSK